MSSHTSVLSIYGSRSLIWCTRSIFWRLFQSHFDQPKLVWPIKIYFKIWSKSICFREVYFTLITLMHSDYFFEYICIRLLFIFIFIPLSITLSWESIHTHTLTYTWPSLSILDDLPPIRTHPQNNNNNHQSTFHRFFFLNFSDPTQTFPATKCKQFSEN